MDAIELARTLRPRITDALIAVDFDGTLAPLVADPEASRPVPGAIEALAELARQGAAVAVITGRAAETVLRLGGLDAVPGITIVGVYGAETWHDGELSSPNTPAEITALREQLPATLDGAGKGVWIEDKRLSLVVHARQAADPAAELERLLPAVTAVADRLGVEIHPGSGVLELRLPGFDKGAALRRLADGRGAVLFAGDDLGDVPAFEQVQRLRGLGVAALGFAVRSTAVPEVLDVADASVADAQEFVAVLTALATP